MTRITYNTGPTSPGRRRLLAAGLAVAGTLASSAVWCGESRWAREMAAFDAAHARGVEAGATVFTGSSSIAGWDQLAEDFPSRPVLKHGLNGARINDIVDRFDRLAGRFRPSVIVVFAGSNDLVPSRPGKPEDVVEGVRALLGASRSLPTPAPIVWIEITPTPRRAARLADVLEANRRVRQLAAREDDLYIVPAAEQFLNADGNPRQDYFVADGLHLNRRGYQVWRAALDHVFARLD